ncbi:MAG: hypothetical protein ACLPUT_16330 [Solirubrobacteraceae bacterium]
MFSSARRHLSYANVAATMALVFAMGGTAIAAKHYLISSTSQISPQVLKAIEVKIAGRVPRGKEGKEGPAGKEGKAGESGGEGKPGVSLLSSAEQEALKAVLPYIRLVSSGVDGKPTIQFTGANVQILSGAGKESALGSGEGNLIVGYDESPREQTGSNDIVIGSSKQEYTSYGALVAGSENAAIDPYTDVFGMSNIAQGEGASISGGDSNYADGEWSSVSGGYENTANRNAASVSGGNHNEALGIQSSVSGGYKNEAKGDYSSIFGGKEQTASASYEALP